MRTQWAEFYLWQFLEEDTGMLSEVCRSYVGVGACHSATGNQQTTMQTSNKPSVRFRER